REAAGHVSVDHIVDRLLFRSFACENFIAVAVIDAGLRARRNVRNGLSARDAWTKSSRVAFAVSGFVRQRHERAERARRLTRSCRPIEAVHLTRIAAELTGVFAHAPSGAVGARVFTLRIDVAERHFDYCEFVAADAAVDDLGKARGRIEAP